MMRLQAQSQSLQFVFSMLLVLGAAVPGCGPASVRDRELLPEEIRDSAGPDLASDTLPADTGQGQGRKKVVVLSIDGCRWDYVDDQRLPVLSGMKGAGASATQVNVTVPSMSMPGHVTMLTGTWASGHGIVFNKFYDRKEGFIKWSDGIPQTSQVNYLLAEPLWVTAKKAGLVTASVHWPATTGTWGGQSMELAVPFEAGWNNEKRVTKGIEILLGLNPDLLFVYTNGVAPPSYQYGPGTEQVFDTLEKLDLQVGRLYESIKTSPWAASTWLAVVSDHGFGPALKKELCVSWLLDREGVGYDFVLWGGVGQVFLKDAAGAPAVAALLEEQEGVARVVLGENAAQLHLETRDRTGDVLLVMEPGYQVANMWRSCDAAIVDPQPGYEQEGTHGQPSVDYEDLRGIFILVGPGIGKCNLGLVRQIDIAPTIAALLGIPAPADADGVALDLSACKAR